MGSAPVSSILLETALDLSLILSTVCLFRTDLNCESFNQSKRFCGCHVNDMVIPVLSYCIYLHLLPIHTYHILQTVLANNPFRKKKEKENFWKRLLAINLRSYFQILSSAFVSSSIYSPLGIPSLVRALLITIKSKSALPGFFQTTVSPRTVAIQGQALTNLCESSDADKRA